jgi:acyl-CoA thioester hydrolase
MASRFSISIPLVPSDCNGGKHVDHLRFYAFFEQARFAYLQTLHLHEILARERCTYLVKRTELVYEAEVFLGDTVTVAVWPVRLGNSTVDLGYEVLRNGAARACTGTTTLVFADPAVGKSRPLPAELRAAFASVMPQ